MKKTFLSIVLLFVVFVAFADEGMWILKELNKQSIARMQELGFVFPIDQLYDENNPSLKDAVVIFGGGCSGVAVSDQGLIFTNHHCGYDAIQKLSSIEQDYLKNGFMADSYENELQADGLTVSFLQSMQDVTDEILPKIPSVLNEVQRELAIDSISDLLLTEYDGNPFIDAQVIPFYAGNKYYRVVYDVFRDVRLVIAPPQSIGKFGGETDNWMWPRHTGDFSVFRVYADKDNKPAEYSKDNVPYKPKYVVPVSLKGMAEGDYAMTIGYPGRTQRYLSSWGIKQMMESENKPRIEVRGVKQQIWWDAMTKSDVTRIKYASKYAGSSNYWKNAKGMNVALVKMNVVSEKESLESRMEEWINSDQQRKEKYGDVLSILKEAYTETNDLAKYTTYFLETFHNGIEIIRFANTILQFDANGSQQEKQEFISDRIINAYKNYNPDLDKKVLAELMKLYAERVPEQYHPDIYKTIQKKFKGNYDKYADWLFKHSKFTNLDDLLEFLKTADIKKLIKDPAMELALSVKDMGYELSSQMIPAYEKIMQGERKFMSALMEMNPDKEFYPDANFTQRLSYGTIKGYQPRDAVWYHYFSTTQGVLEKEIPDDPEFEVQPFILDILKMADFDRYADKDGKMHVCFLSDNDITGGNSGSPVFNGNAELLGLAFDGNWEALSGDVIFEPEMQRTISVDIRYILFVIDKIMKAPHIVNELNLVQ
ncbi:S46 family peptidase [Anaerorudis cellulosivorans]|uniref:S46 family peptidase n=1 Tax=Anaerorudis cellulosivorans TaxID=3397862 RepID=UPI0022207FC2|nr:S46 family peptidase [Seramator thermalis]MCW1734493.1 S46 family peptidase [Seramator thermalis]